MRGETVIVKTPFEVGRDEHNNPILDMATEQVENVLIAPQEGELVGGSTRPFSHYLRYTLYFPKEFQGDLEGGMVCVRGSWFDVVGSPDYWDPEVCPTDWNRTVYVGVTHG